MGEKGSLKNLYKELWMRINYRLRKKKEEEELIRRMEKKYKLSFKDKTKLSFSLILGTIFYSFFSIFSKRYFIVSYSPYPKGYSLISCSLLFFSSNK